MDVNGATEQLQRKLLSWCYYTLNDRFDQGLGVFDEGALTPVPRNFRDAAHYRSVWEPLLLEEAGAQIVRGIEEGVVLEPQPAVVKRFEDPPGNATGRGAAAAAAAGAADAATTMPFSRVSVGVTTARGTFAANDLILLSKDEPHGKSVRRHLHAIGLVEQLEGSDSLRVKLQLSDDAQAGSAQGLARARATRAELAASAASTDARAIWYLLRLCNASTITREWVALQHVHLLPFLDVVLSGRASASGADAEAPATAPPPPATAATGPLPPASTQPQQKEPEIPGGMAAALERGCNASQLAAVRSGLRGGAVTLIQGPPGTGKTRTILSLLSLVLHAAAAGWGGGGAAGQQGAGGGGRGTADALTGAAEPGTPPREGEEDEGAEEEEDAEARAARKAAERERLWRLQSPWMFGLPCARDAVLPSRDTGSQRAAEAAGAAADAFGLALAPRSQPRPHAVGSARAPRAHVLVCAPSNSALDEIVLRLLSSGLVDGRGRSYTPSLVRVGVNAHRSVRAVALDALVDARLAAAAAGGGATANGGGGAGNGAAAAGSSAATVPAATTTTSVSPAVRDAARRAVLAEAAVVCSTLSFAGSPLLQRLAGGRHFDVVVVDEAAQAVEPSLLVPLVMGLCRRAVLVGDPAQLPATVISAAAAARGYAGSLFARLEAAGHPVHVLDTQYRMHPAISRFPSRCFYGGRLRDGEGAEERASRPWLRALVEGGGKGGEGGKGGGEGDNGGDGGALGPLAFHDVRGREEVPKGSASMVNRAEAHACLELYRLLMKAAAKVRAGGGGGGGGKRGGGGKEAEGASASAAAATTTKKPPPAAQAKSAAAKGATKTEEELQEQEKGGGRRGVKKNASKDEEGDDDANDADDDGDDADDACLEGGRGVAIISPYKAQVRLLRQLFQDRLGPAAQHLDINTIDGFQGREKDVVLFSAVRTRGAPPPPRGGRLASPDGGGSIGFVADERRLNVGLTRARCALMVVGHGPSLAADPNWRALLRHACRERRYWHCPPAAAEAAEAAEDGGGKGGEGGDGDGGDKASKKSTSSAGNRRAKYFADAAAGRVSPAEPDDLLLARLGGTYDGDDAAAEAALAEARERRARERAEAKEQRRRYKEAASGGKKKGGAGGEDEAEEAEDEEEEAELLAAAASDDDAEVAAVFEGVEAVDFLAEAPAGGEEPVLISAPHAAQQQKPGVAAAAGGGSKRAAADAAEEAAAPAAGAAKRARRGR